MAKQKVIKVGNSLAVTLPSRVVKNLSIKTGDEVEATQTEDNSITYNFINPQQLSLSQMKLPTTKVPTKKS